MLKLTRAEKNKLNECLHLSLEGSPGRPGCSSSARSWTDTDTPGGWGAPTPAASRPNRAPCDTASSVVWSGSSARTASGGPFPSEVHWKTDQVKIPKVPDLSALEKSEKKHIRHSKTLIKCKNIFPMIESNYYNSEIFRNNSVTAVISLWKDVTLTDLCLTVDLFYAPLRCSLSIWKC